MNDFGAYLLVFDPKSLPDSCILTKNIKDKMAKVATQYSKANLIQSKVVKKEWPGKMNKLFSIEEANEILEKYNIMDESVMFLAYGSKNDAVSVSIRELLEFLHCY